MLLDELMEPLAFPTHNEYGGFGVIGFAVQLLAALVQAINPEAAFFQQFQRLGDVSDADDRQMLESTGGSFGDGFGEWGGAALGNENRRGCGGVCGADDGSEVVGIFDAIEQDEQLGAGDDIFEPNVALRGSEGHDTLVRRAIRGTVERLARLEAHGDGTLASQVDDLLKTGATGSARDQHAVERAAGAQRFLDGVDAGEQAARLVRLLGIGAARLRTLPV